MRIFLICLSLLYVLGVSFTQRMSLGDQSCVMAGSGLSINDNQVGVLSDGDDKVANIAETGQGHFGSAIELIRAGNSAGTGRIGYTGMVPNPC